MTADSFREGIENGKRIKEKKKGWRGGALKDRDIVICHILLVLPVTHV